MITSNSTSVESRYLGRVPFARALAAQTEAARRVGEGPGGLVLGFESEPVVTLGLRGREATDVVDPEWPVIRVDRGGQATIHHPGQLVIFPVCTLAGRTTRAWVDLLMDVTIEFARGLGQTLTWREDAPGLWGERGKVVAMGLRIRRGLSTHGLAINVRNRLEDFARIRACGVQAAAVEHLVTDQALATLFDRWVSIFGQKSLLRNTSSTNPLKISSQDPSPNL